MTKFFTFAFLAILLSGIGRALASQLPPYPSQRPTGVTSHQETNGKNLSP